MRRELLSEAKNKCIGTRWDGFTTVQARIEKLRLRTEEKEILWYISKTWISSDAMDMFPFVLLARYRLNSKVVPRSLNLLLFGLDDALLQIVLCGMLVGVVKCQPEGDEHSRKAYYFPLTVFTERCVRYYLSLTALVSTSFAGLHDSCHHVLMFRVTEGHGSSGWDHRPCVKADEGMQNWSKWKQLDLLWWDNKRASRSTAPCVVSAWFYGCVMGLGMSRILLRSLYLVIVMEMAFPSQSNQTHFREQPLWVQNLSTCTCPTKSLFTLFLMSRCERFCVRWGLDRSWRLAFIWAYWECDDFRTAWFSFESERSLSIWFNRCAFRLCGSEG